MNDIINQCLKTPQHKIYIGYWEGNVLFNNTLDTLYGIERKENVLFNDSLNTFYLQLYGVRHMIKNHSDRERGNLLSPHRLLAAGVLLYAPCHRQDNTYHSLCYTSRGALAGTKNSSMGPPWRINPTTHHTMSKRSYHRATSHSLIWYQTMT